MGRNADATPRDSDRIIACMGPTGSGKSNIIDFLSGHQTNWSGTRLKSVTDKVSSIRVRNPVTGDDSLVLVDTPGFDDTTKTDMEILQMISDWLTKTYERKIPLTGILYLHRITDNRMSGTPHRNLRMFGELCGERAAEKVILVTTMWDKMGSSESRLKAEGRETELKTRYWSKMIELGASTARFDNKDETAQAFIRKLLSKNDQNAVLLQEEMVDMHRPLNETQAGKALYSQLQKVLSQQKETIEALQSQAKNRDNPRLVEELEAELRRIQVELDKTFAQVSKLKIPWLRRMMIALFGKKASAEPIKI